MVDVWWGITEPEPNKYNFAPYRRLIDEEPTKTGPRMGCQSVVGSVQYTSSSCAEKYGKLLSVLDPKVRENQEMSASRLNCKLAARPELSSAEVHSGQNFFDMFLTEWFVTNVLPSNTWIS